MGMPRWILGGLLGGAAGVVIWVVVGYLTQYEVGWIAWGVGFLVGVGVRYSAYLDGHDEDLNQGILASVIAVGAIVAAKFLLFSILVDGADAGPLREALGRIRFDEEGMIASIADDVALEMANRGIALQWPPEMTYDTASRKADYPAEVWQHAETRWNQLGTEEQEERKRQRRIFVAELSDALSGPKFREFFSPWDIVWFALATITAYKIGVGTYGDD